jgi:hypothetical protein
MHSLFEDDVEAAVIYQAWLGMMCLSEGADVLPNGI